MREEGSNEVKGECGVGKRRGGDQSVEWAKLSLSARFPL